MNSNNDSNKNNDSFARFHALPPNTILKDTYIIQGVLGEGGFGITYNGYQKETGTHIAIKEYFPHTLAIRTIQDGLMALRPFPEKNLSLFEKGRQHFLNEAKILKELPELASIVSVYDYFEENGTAYIVMPYIEGLTLGQYIRQNGPLSFSEILFLMIPVMESLIEIHSKGLIHCDISPDNLILSTDSHLYLIDFGAASHKNTANSHSTVILKTGYAPPEQYISDGKTGAWIDVYALCATMYFAITGEAPSDAILRLENDSLEPLSALQNILPWQKDAIEKGLSLRSANRFHSMAELYHALTTPPDMTDASTQIGSHISRETARTIRRMHSHHRWLRFLWIPAFCFVLLFVLKQIFTAPSETETPGSSPAAVNSELSSSEHPVPAPSSQPEVLSMLNVTDMTEKKAKSTLKKLDASIKVKTVYTYDDTIPARRVIAQSVVPSTLFSKGHLSSVLLTVSKGAKPLATPRPTKSALPDKSEKRKQTSDYKVTPQDEYTTIHID